MCLITLTVLYSEMMFAYLFCNSVLEVWLVFVLFNGWYIGVCLCLANSLFKLCWLEIWLGQDGGPCWSELQDSGPCDIMGRVSSLSFLIGPERREVLWWLTLKGEKSTDFQLCLGSCRTKTSDFSRKETEIGGGICSLHVVGPHSDP